MSSKDIFLSYGREPEVVGFVTQLKHDLQNQGGLSVWLDTEDIPAGCDWHAAIGTGLHNCKALIAVITTKYITSRYCTSELYTADGDQKLIFPVIFEDVDFGGSEKAKGVKYVISGINWTMFRPSTDNYQMSLAKLIQGMREQGLGVAGGAGSDSVDAGIDLATQMSGMHLSPSPYQATPSAPPPASPHGYQQPPHTSSYGGYPQYPPSPYNYHVSPPPTAAYPYTPPHAPMQAHGYYPPNMPVPMYPYQQPYSSPPQPPNMATPPHVTAPYSMTAPPPQYTEIYPDTSPAATPTTASTEKPVPLFEVGMKVEADDRRFPYFVCVATITDKNDAEDEVLIHFDGWSEEYDYWCSSQSVEIHPVGWCDKHGWELQKPHNHPSWSGWDAYLQETKAQAAPDKIFSEGQLSGPGSLLFSPGMRVEAKDRKFPTLTCVATITDVKKGKVHIHFDGWGNEYDYWCPACSTDIHPPMWCSENGKNLEVPKGQFKWSSFQWNIYLSDPDINPAPAHLFTEEQLSADGRRRTPQRLGGGASPDGFKVGMKVEAVDRRFPYFVCVATIMDRDDSEVLIHFDGWSEEYDYWCSSQSVEIHPVGWCDKHGWELQKPQNYAGYWSGWDAYLQETESQAAPDKIFSEGQLAGPGSLLFSPGMRVEAKDRKFPTLTCVATITDVKKGKVHIHFDGWGNEYDYWCPASSTDIHPPMWCNKNQQKVQPPNGFSGTFQWNTYLSDPEVNPAPAHLFTEAQLGTGGGKKIKKTAAAVVRDTFKVGMKLEAKDRLNPSMIAVATVNDIKDGKLLIHFDGWSTRYDYWCQPESVDIHPMGWCADSRVTLHPPRGMSGFSWRSYLQSCNAVAAPNSAFTDAQLN